MSTCQHLAEYKTAKGSCTFRIIHAFFVACVTKSSRQRKARECFCHVCESRTKRIHACLSCVYFGCYYGGHIHQHAAETQHYLAIDTSSGYVFCYACDDCIYDPEFEAIANRHKLQMARHSGNDAYSSWEPRPNEVELLREQYDTNNIVDGTYLGLRGLVNLGNTCFMSCIIQALIHTPLLRDYFLADRHVCHFQDEPSMCLVCEMSKLFQEFYSGKKIPYIPYRLLQLVWTHAEHLSGYFQQDAHEFLIVALNILHMHCKGMIAVPSKNDHICNCIIDQIFTGFLQSELVCAKCNNISNTIEPFWDLSLGLGTSPDLHYQNQEKADSLSDSSEPQSLFDCLERFTQPECVGGRACESCGSYQSSTKQMTLQKLPLVISFHFKRLLGVGKNRNFISFPECLDMTPFISSVRSTGATEMSETVHSCISHSDNKFYLFAVVNHAGDFDSGHYYTFVRQHKSKWFKCDDHLVTKASIQEVLSSEAYLLFYHKTILEYEVCDVNMM